MKLNIELTLNKIHNLESIVNELRLKVYGKKFLFRKRHYSELLDNYELLLFRSYKVLEDLLEIENS